MRSPPTSPRTPPERDENGRRLVVRNWAHARPREVTTVAGAVGVSKELVALADGHRVHRVVGGPAAGCQAAGHTGAGAGRGDGALGFWAALREVLPETMQGRCRVHKVVNVLDWLPKSAQPAVRQALAQIRDAEDREHAEKAIKNSAAYGAKYPKAVAKITDA
jgi:putative transposase